MTIFDTLTMSLFGVSLGDNAIAGFDGLEFLAAQDTALREGILRVVIPFRRFMFWDRGVRAADQALEKVRQLGTAMLHAARSQDQHQRSLLHCDDKSIMGHILRNDYPSDEHRVADIIVFMIAGHETTAHTLSFCLYSLARAPAALRRLQTELDCLPTTGLPLERGGAAARMLTLADLTSADYLSHCIREGQRWG